MAYKMKRILAILLFVTAPILLSAQERKVGIAYDLSADVRFDNREYPSYDTGESKTLFGIRAGAAVGLKFNGHDSQHKILGGIAPLYQFGGDWLFEPLLYYKLDKTLRHSDFNIVAGAFRRDESKAYYSVALFSEEYNFLRGVTNGFQFSWKTQRTYTEFGIDWIGMIRPQSPKTREEFLIYTGGMYDINDFLSVGYAGYLHHYACSYENSNVVDDGVLNPYLKLDFGKKLNLQELSLRAGVVAKYQNDRVDETAYIPVNGDIHVAVRKWNVVLENETFFGQEMLPLYNSLAPDGTPYGTALYKAEPLLRHRNGGSFGYFDRLALSWQPNLAKGLSMIIKVTLDFNEGLIGSQQVIQLKYRF